MGEVDVMALPLLGVVSRFGYFGVTGIVLIESFGVPAPGETVIIAGSAYAGGGHLNVFVIGIAAFLAAVVGDSIGYWIGRTGGRGLVLKFGRYVRLTGPRLERIERFMAKRGALMVIVARYVEGLRQFNGLVAGITRMPFGRFLLCNAIGAALWVGTWASVGYFAGNHFEVIEGAIHRYSYYAIGAAVLLIAAYALIHWRRHRAHRLAEAAASSSTSSSPGAAPSSELAPSEDRAVPEVTAMAAGPHAGSEAPAVPAAREAPEPELRSATESGV